MSHLNHCITEGCGFRGHQFALAKPGPTKCVSARCILPQVKVAHLYISGASNRSRARESSGQKSHDVCYNPTTSATGQSNMAATLFFLFFNQIGQLTAAATASINLSGRLTRRDAQTADHASLVGNVQLAPATSRILRL